MCTYKYECTYKFEWKFEFKYEKLYEYRVRMSFKVHLCESMKISVKIIASVNEYCMSLSVSPSENAR